MPVTLPDTLIGPDGLATIETYSDPRFVFTAMTELEDSFVAMLGYKFALFKANDEVTEPPAIVPAYNPGDRKSYAVVVEATINQITSQGLNYNRREVHYQPDPVTPDEYWTYEAQEGDAQYTVDLSCIAPTRFAVGYIADWVVSALMDPVCRRLAAGGIQIPYNALRFSGKPQEIAGQDGKSKGFRLGLSIPGIILPWARMYRVDSPWIEEVGLAYTQNTSPSLE